MTLLRYVCIIASNVSDVHYHSLLSQSYPRFFHHVLYIFKSSRRPFLNLSHYASMGFRRENVTNNIDTNNVSVNDRKRRYAMEAYGLSPSFDLTARTTKARKLVWCVDRKQRWVCLIRAKARFHSNNGS